jgi:hypothetical protein
LSSHSSRTIIVATIVADAQKLTLKALMAPRDKVANDATQLAYKALPPHVVVVVVIDGRSRGSGLVLLVLLWRSSDGWPSTTTRRGRARRARGNMTVTASTL